MNKIIHQIYISSDGYELPEPLKEKSDKKKELYPEYEYILWNNETLSDMIKENFGYHVLDMYNRCNANAAKADLGRLCYLFVYGGIHFDIGIDVMKKKEFHHNYEDVVAFSYNKQRNFVETNFLFSNKPRNVFIKLAINEVVKRIENRYYGENPLDATGVMTISFVYNNLPNRLKVKLKELDIYWGYDESKFTMIDNDIFYFFKKDSLSGEIASLGGTGVNDYNELWYAGNFYKND